MVPEIVLTSTSFIDGDVINPNFKSAVNCGEANLSPQFAWQIFNMVIGHIEYFNIYVEDVDVAGSSPNNKFLHLGVTNIPTTQLYISENGLWQSGTILPSDYGSGDRANGWNGPCATAPHTYNCWVEAKIYNNYLSYLFGKNPPVNGILKSAVITFTDNPRNITIGPQTGDCGTSMCQPGTTSIDGFCQAITSVPAIISTTKYTVTAVTPSSAWGWAGTRFYADADNYALPLTGNGTAVLVDADSTVLPFSLVNTGNLWRSPSTSYGRLNLAGIWTELQTGDYKPTSEWIGFSTCININTAGKYSIGLAGDNRLRIKVNGVLIANWALDATQNFNYWHIIEVNLNAGSNIIVIEGMNSGSVAAFGAEVYDVDVVTLATYTTELELEPHIIFTTRDKIGELFDTGENSGVVCPNGFVYDKCDSGDCVSITYTLPEVVECCWLIQNCFDPEEAYLIKLAFTELTPLYGNDVYEFRGSDNFEGKCFTVIGQEVCTRADYENVTVGATHGTNNCIACSIVHKFASCSERGTYRYVTLAPGEGPLLMDNIYRIENLTDDTILSCHAYVGQEAGILPEFTDVHILSDFGTADCLICVSCHEFIDCSNNEHIFVRFVDFDFIPDADYIYELSGHANVINRCLIYQGLADGDTEGIINDVTAVASYPSCRACKPFYKLTDCATGEVSYMYWPKDETPLDTTKIYVFDFAPDNCYTVELIRHWDYFYNRT